MSERERFDSMLLAIAQQRGSIENILDTFFDFLLRKTDFFTGVDNEEKPKKLLEAAFQKHWKMSNKARSEETAKNRAADEERAKRRKAQEEKDHAEYAKKQAEKAQQASEAKFEEVDDAEADRIQAAKKAKQEKKEEEAPASEKAQKDGGPKEIPEEKTEEEDDGAPPPEGNGGATDKYRWTQTLQALEVFIELEPGTKARQIVCDIAVSTLKVGIKGRDLILNGKMHSKVKPDDCTWTLIDNKLLQISMEKHDDMKWWSSVMEGDTEINTRKIVPENSKLSDLDGETRMTVEKMMFDQRQKAAGLPTSDQQKQHDLLQKFQAAHPEMDFSKAKINYGGGSGGFNM